MSRRRGGRVVAQGRIDNGPPVGVIDIGSNSVRLVVYEGLTRSLTPIFNEKVLAGLGREVLSTGLLADDAIDKALAALVRFRALCQAMHRLKGEMSVRRILGMLSLAKKYGVAAADDACDAALEVGVCEYSFVRRYLERHPQLPLSLRQVDPLIRQLTLYRDLIENRTQENQP